MKHDHLATAGKQLLVTDNEVAASQVRLHAVAAEHAAHTYGGGIPQWAQAMMAMIQNQRIRTGNTQDHTWSPLLVETLGANPVGVPAVQFPATRNFVFGLTAAQLDSLETDYNVPGQFGGATVRDRRNAFLRYVSG